MVSAILGLFFIIQVKATGCGVVFHLEEMKYFVFSFLLSVPPLPLPQYAMAPQFGEKWETRCLNIRFPLPTLFVYLECGIQLEASYLFISTHYPAQQVDIENLVFIFLLLCNM